MNNDYSTGTVPKTLQELKEYCENNNLTPSKTRFFIDYDYSGAKAFGIYKDEATGQFVVYKNMADGSRVIRYQGTDEEFAVMELFDRLQDEIENQKIRYAADMAERERNMFGGKRSVSSVNSESSDSYDILKQGDYKFPKKRRRRYNEEDIVVRIVQAIFFVIVMLIALSMARGSAGGSRRHSSYYDDNYSYSSSYDNDYSWSSDDWSTDDWDSGYTDWDSDW